jgi:site-specific recombinase XerD
MKYLKTNELLKVLEVASQHGTREHAICLLAYKHALRASEIASLTLSDVRNNQIDVRRLKGSLHTIQPLQAHANPLLNEPSVLKAWLRDRGSADGSQLLFTSRQGSGLSRRQIFNIFESIAIRAGIEEGRRNVHILKHSLCAHLVRAGQSVAFVQISAGHRDPKSTLYYAHVTDEEAALVTGKTLDSVFS